MSPRARRLDKAVSPSLEDEHSAVPPHEHDPHDHPLRGHTHGDLQGHLKGSVRGLLAVLELGSVNTEQRKAIHDVRVIIGDAHGDSE